MQITRFLIPLVAISIALSVPLTATAKAKTDSKLAGKLIGNWKIVRWVKKDKEGKPPPGMTVSMHFKKDGTWAARLTFQGQTKPQKGGTWKLQGNTLVTTSSKGASTMAVKIHGSTLELTKKGQDDRLILKRI